MRVPPGASFVNQTVNESVPTNATGATAPAAGGSVVLASSRFHHGAHKTFGVAAFYQLPRE